MRRVREISIVLAVTSPSLRARSRVFRAAASTPAARYPKPDGVGNRTDADALTSVIARAAAVAPLLLAGCDPIVEIQGTFFPAWLLCMIVGVVATVALRPLFVRLGIEPFMGPLPLIYPSLAVLLTLAAWLVFFRT
jgi:hypothetical protein